MDKLIIAGLLMGMVLGCGSEKPKETPKTEAAKTEEGTKPNKMELAASVKNKVITLTGKEWARIETNKGAFEATFYPNDAPQSVKNFIRLAEVGFYDGLTFHRYAPDFVIQGGDPLGTGMGNCGWNIPLEVGKPKHITGALGMARSTDPNSNSCQFYVVLNTAPHLDGQYTVFGQVRKGMDVVQQLRMGDVMTKVTIFKE
jgi:cyclophilin family peptidyl-prolyl cis-trans isomerase